MFRAIKRNGKDSYKCIKCTRDSDARCYAKNKTKRLAHTAAWVAENKGRKLAVDAVWRQANGPHRRQYMKDFVQARRRLVLNHYGNGSPACVCCGESLIQFLCLDHIEGGGNQHRAQVGGGTSFYAWIVKNNFPAGFRVLCHNCNFARGAYGQCPHEALAPLRLAA